MTIESAIYNELSTTAEITAVVSTRIYPQVAPESAAYPFITFLVVSEVPEHHMGGAAPLTRVMMQFDVWAETHAERVDIAEVLRNALDGFRGDMGTENLDIQSCFLENRSNFQESDTEGKAAPVFRTSMDFSIWHVLPVPTL